VVKQVDLILELQFPIHKTIQTHTWTLFVKTDECGW